VAPRSSLLLVVTERKKSKKRLCQQGPPSAKGMQQRQLAKRLPRVLKSLWLLSRKTNSCEYEEPILTCCQGTLVNVPTTSSITPIKKGSTTMSMGQRSSTVALNTPSTLKSSKPEYFGEALEICEEQGLIPLMTFSHNFSKEVICQFYATVVFLEDEGGFRTLKWMTKEFVMEATWQEFARGIGYDLPDNETNFLRIHLQPKPMAKEKMTNLYIPGRMLCGSA
jgi:hypothetical protein